MTFTLPTTGSGPVMSTKQWLEGAINAAIEAAVSAAALGFVLYGSVSAGLAATQDGEGFSVFTATGLQLYANSAGVADLQGEIPLASTTTALAARITALEDQAFAESPIYETTAEGIAATGEGDRFRVENADAAIAYDIYDHDPGGVATFVTDIPAGSALATKLTTSNALSELVGVADAARANIGAASARDVTQLKARHLARDGFEGWAAPVYDREGRIGGGWKRDGTFHAKGFGAAASGAAERDDPRTPIVSGSDGRVALSVDRAGMLRGKGFATPARVAPARDVPHLPVVHDLFGRASIALEPSGAVVLPKISERTAQMIRALVGVSESIPGGLLAGVPGWNHRIYDAEHYLVTMPTKMGPVDALYPVAGAGLQIAATRKPVELLSVSGQSNTFLGGDMAAGINGFALRGVHDPHRAFRSAHGNSWGDGSGSAAAYTPGDLSAMVPAGQNAEPNNAGQFTPDVIQFSAIATDLREGRQQGVYLQLTSAESGTPLTQYMAGTTKGDNIASYIPAAETLMQGTYGRDLIMYAHFLIGHEGTDFTGYSSYAELLSAFADQVCGYGEALDANVAAGVRPKVIAYQPNNYTTDAGTPDGKTIRQTALDTLSRSLTDPDVVCIGPVYHEHAVDNGIHMTGKLMTGELFAHVYDKVRAGEDWVPLHITSASLDGAVITLEIDGPAGMLALDDDWMPELTHAGLFYGDDSSSAAISSIELVSASATSRTIEVTLDGAPSGANPTIYVSGHNNTADGTRPGGMAGIYVPGPRSFWHAAGYTRWTTPEIRFYLCRQQVAVS